MFVLGVCNLLVDDFVSCVDLVLLVINLVCVYVVVLLVGYGLFELLLLAVALFGLWLICFCSFLLFEFVWLCCIALLIWFGLTVGLFSGCDCLLNVSFCLLGLDVWDFAVWIAVDDYYFDCVCWMGLAGGFVWVTCLRDCFPWLLRVLLYACWLRLLFEWLVCGFTCGWLLLFFVRCLLH